MGLVLSLWRALRVIESVMTGAIILAYVSVLRRFAGTPAWLPDAVCWWHRRLCRSLGLRLEVSGQVAAPCLLVVNHISWLDVPVLGAQAPIGFLSKSEVRRWPLVGWMAVVAGTLFIARGANQVGDVAAQIGAGIAAGRTLTIFPEGTTSDGRQVQRFHPRIFAIAQQPGLRLQPVALTYRRGHQPPPDPGVPFVGDDTLVANLLRVIRHPDLVAQVRFLEPMTVAPGEERRVIASRARAAIVAALDLPEGEARRMPVIADEAPDPTMGTDHSPQSRRAEACQPGAVGA